MSDVYLFLGIIVLIFVVWVAEGGPAHPISFAGPYITPITTVGGTASGYSLRSASSTSSSRTSSSVASRAQSDISSLERAVVSSTRFGVASTYKDKVTLRYSTSALKNDDPDKEYLTVSAGTRVGATGVNITGWSIESAATGRIIGIPGGVNLPTSGSVNASGPIVLTSGQTATIVVGDSPIGISFRENMCTGYFDQFQDFAPSIAHACPLPSSDFDRFYLGDARGLDACKAYVKTVARCVIPLNVPSNTDSACRQFIDTRVNYNGCVATHQTDKGFWGNDWRVYLGQGGQFFTESHDTIKLLDATGNTVDLISY